MGRSEYKYISSIHLWAIPLSINVIGRYGIGMPVNYRVDFKYLKY